MTPESGPVVCSECGSPTFRIRKEYSGDHIPGIGTTNIVVYCSKCGNKYYTVTLSGDR